MAQFDKHPLLNGVSAFAVLVSLGLTGCLDTREAQKEQEEKIVMRKQVQNLAATTADVNSRFQDVEDEIRRLTGRIEATDQKVKQTNTLMDKGFGMADTKFKEKDEVYREEFTKLRTEVDSLKAQLTAILEENRKAAQAAADAAQAAAAKAKEADKNPFASAEEKYTQKNWKEAILDYEKYRKNNPKGKQFATATYKIGLCFQELGLSDDARAFFDEVIEKYPKSKEAKQAATHLKKLKK